MRGNGLKWCGCLIIAAVCLIVSPAVQAAPGDGAESPAAQVKTRATPWTTMTHLGFAVADHSSTGFKAVGGSVAFLDVTTEIASHWDFGLRSIAVGGRSSERQYYRLGAGPLLTWRLHKNWLLQGSLALFRESGLAADGGRLYQSRGQEAMLGWARVWTVAPRVEIAWGGFFSYHRGTLSPEQPAALAPVPRSLAGAAATMNAGVSHGLEAAIRLSL